MENKNRIKDKIKALLSKTIDNGATKEEMESALNKANQLMLENFISEHDLKDENLVNKCVLRQIDLVKTGYDLTLFYADLAFLFDCEHYYTNSKITFFGHEQDAELCCYFYNVIARTCLNEKDKFMKTNKYLILKRWHHGKTLVASFIKGFLVEICLKMKQMYKDRQSNIPESYGLMVIEKTQKVKFEFDNLDVKITREKQKAIKAESIAFENGIEAGKKVNLIQGLQTNKEAFKLF